MLGDKRSRAKPPTVTGSGLACPLTAASCHSSTLDAVDKNSSDTPLLALADVSMYMASYAAANFLASSSIRGTGSKSDLQAATHRTMGLVCLYFSSSSRFFRNRLRPLGLDTS